MINTVVFDLDDTLIAEVSVDEGVLAGVCTDAGARFGFDSAGLDQTVIAIAERELPRCGEWPGRAGKELSWAEALWGPFEQGDRGLLAVEWAAVREFRELVWSESLRDATGERDEIAAWCATEYAVLRAGTQPLMDGATDVLAALRTAGLRLGLLTNGTVSVQETKLDRSGLRQFFDEVVISGALPWSKPDPRIFQEMLSRLEAPSETTLMVGNSRFHDIDPALALGMHSAWLTNALVSEPPTGTVPVRSLNHVLAHPALAGGRGD